MTTLQVTNISDLTKWQFDPIHSSVEFSIRYMGGKFKSGFDEIEVNTDNNKISGSVNIDDIKVKDNTLKGHLMSPDFFDQENYPLIKFEAEKIETEDNQISLKGILTIKDNHQPINITANINGPVEDPYGNQKLSVYLNHTLNRQDYGLNWNAQLPGGKKMLADEVNVEASLYFILQS